MRHREFPFYNLGDTPLTLKEQKAVNSIIDDFLVNDDTTGGCEQSYPAIAEDPSGNFVITWTDYRNGDPDIYAQRYDSTGNPLGSNYKVNGDAGAYYQSYPAIAMDSSGDFVITWTDYRNGDPDIYAQRYNFSGNPLGSNFKVNDDTGNASPYNPVISAIALDGSGDFVIAWNHDRNGNPDIYAQRYNSSGTSLGTNFKVNDDTGTGYQYDPAVAMDGSGNFVITWQYDPNVWYNADIYAQRYNSAGTPLGTNFKVNDDTGTAPQWYPAIALDGSGDFVITWMDNRNGNGDIYAQRYNFSGAPVDSNFKVNDDTGTAYQWYPAIALDGSGNFVITWMDNRNGNGVIYAQRYNSSGTSLGSNFKVNDDTGTGYQYDPAVALDGSGNFVIAWRDERNGWYNADIYTQRYNSSGNPLGSNFRVNDDTGTSDQLLPAIALDGSGDFVITWMDNRNDNSDIYAQRYNFSGTPLGSNFKVNDDAGTSDQRFPAIALDGSGNFVIAWEGRYSYQDIYAQRYNFSGTPLGSNFKVNDDTGTAYQYSTAISLDGSGNFVITWTDDRNGNGDIYAQRYNFSGAPVGSNFKGNDDVGTASQNFPAISLDGTGNFVITWEDNRNGDPDIYAQRYDFSGTPLGSNFKVNDDVGAIYNQYPVIAMDDSGNFIITWQYDPNVWYNADIYAQRYNFAGTALGSNFKVNDDAGTAYQLVPAIALDGSGNFVIAWTDQRNGWYNSDIYAQRYNPSGNPIGSNYLVPNIQYASFTQESPAVAANSSNIIFTWTENRRAKGRDTYAKVVDWNWTDVRDGNIAGLPTSFELSQNYPNPFNPITIVPFQVGSSEHGAVSPIHTTLKIYNILGQKVRTLVDDEKSPGNYKVIWDGKDDSGKEVSSGIYFYQLKTKDYTDTKKMVLLR